MSYSKYLNVLALQYKPSNNPDKNIEIIKNLLSKRCVKKDTLVICPELSLQSYICLNKNKKNFKQAITLQSRIIRELKNIVKMYKIYLCITIFEKCKNNFFNTAILINSQGHIIKKYHKIHIPSEPCYEERYYFDKSTNNFQIINIKNFKVGIMICWDQWHVKSYQELKQKNVNLIICPTAIGTCIHNKKKVQLKDEKNKWLDVIKSNSLMHNTPIIIVNRTGKESSNHSSINFWGSSFLTDANGDILKKCSSKSGVLSHCYRLEDQISAKKMWNFIDINKLDT